ncbi:hypothetical protein JCM8097_002545 [Rhodosporidiobolus ruineniae]
MRRFPAPPSAGGPSTPGPARSTEAPMQYEWENRDRRYGGGGFVPPAVGGDDDGERARKRTHYEAMDVDTPPRPSFPPSATATSNPFGFGQPSQPFSSAAAEPHPLSFDAEHFRPEKAFGLEDEVQTQEVSMADDEIEAALPAASDQEEGSRALTVPRRRHASGSRRKASSSSGRGVTIETDDEEGSADEGEQGGEGFLGVLQRKVGRRAAGDGQFSFQVHHHHAPAVVPGAGGAAAGEGQAPERWMRSGTPYVLLGYLQFGSLALLAVLVLSLLLLFLYTLYHDIQSRLASLTVELRAEILQCAKSYVDNKCAPETRLPFMESRCAGWEECMNRDVVVSGKTRVVAETLAEVVNGFVDVISFKTMLFVLLTLGLTIYGSSVALSILPSRPAAPPPSPIPSAAPHFAQHAALGYGAPPPGYPLYGLPYAPGSGWVVENGGGGEKQRVEAAGGK